MSSDITHMLTMINGCESINNGDYKSPDSVYASSVLQLHLNDLGQHAGQEGFLEAVKKSAKNIKDFVMRIIKIITDALYLLLGGRTKVKAKIQQFKKSVVPEVFKTKTKKAAEKIMIPALKSSLNSIVSLIDVEYQDFHNRIIVETPAVRTMFLGNNEVEKLLENKIKAGETNPSDDTLEIDSIISLINKNIDKCKAILMDALKDEEGNGKLIKNITNVLGKYNRVIEILNRADKALEEEFK